METALVLENYQYALEHHEMEVCIIHSDRGSKYTNYDCKDFSKENGLLQSLNSVGGRCYENAKCWGE